MNSQPLTKEQYETMVCEACGHRGFGPPNYQSVGGEYGSDSWLAHYCGNCGFEVTTQTKVQHEYDIAHPPAQMWGWLRSLLGATR
jgi:ribosomal protein L37E